VWQVVRMLKMDGHHCVEAIDGLAAVGAISRTLIRRLNGDELPSFDAVLMDKNMPKLSGPQACAEMRRLGFVKVCVVRPPPSPIKMTRIWPH
jgi:CheY-like chemotaxis protein